MNNVVHCGLPRAGLGNRLFPLLKAACFAKLHGFSLVVTGYNMFQLGPYLRGDRTKRNYKGYFKFERSLVGEWLDLQKVHTGKFARVVTEPRVTEQLKSVDGNTLVRFNAVPSYKDYFLDLRPLRELAIREFSELLSDEYRYKWESMPSPCIGVHVRMSDFRKLSAGEDFKNVGSARTPQDYFVDIINQVRELHGSNLPVSLFTDGYRSEIKSLLDLPEVELVEGNRDIEDLLMLSKSKIIVTSAGSTFSYWAGFLSEAAIIHHPMHFHSKVRNSELFFEGPMLHDRIDPLLVENLRSIKKQ